MVFELEVFKVFLLVMVRFSGLLVSAPILGSSSFPTSAKIGLVALTSILITPTVPALDAPLPDGPAAFALQAGGDLIIGRMMGLTMKRGFAGIHVRDEIRLEKDL